MLRWVPSAVGRHASGCSVGRHASAWPRPLACKSQGRECIPVIDISQPSAPAQMYDAWSKFGAFQAIGHGVPVALQDQALEEARKFFALPPEVKERLHVQKGGRAWRGYLPIGGERTHGCTDYKEGLYLGPEHGLDHPRVVAGTPLYGTNQLPDNVLPGLRSALEQYISAVTNLGDHLMVLLSRALGLDEQCISRHVTLGDPIALVRVFSYPPAPSDTVLAWGIGEHTDYGLLTMLKQDAPGLQFKVPGRGWVDVPVVEDAFVCSVGDVLDRLTDGRLPSLPHRVHSTPSNAPRPRLSIPFFYDPCWDAEMKPLPLSHLPPVPPEAVPDRTARWEATSIRSFQGPYSAFLAKKVAKVFPDLVPDSVAETLTTTKAPSTRFAIHVPVTPVSATASK